MPALARWLARFALPSALSIAATYAALWFLQRTSLAQSIAKEGDAPRLSAAGKTTGWGIAMMAVVMLGASAMGIPLGWPTLAAGIAVFVVV
jgi:arsenical pump membrane protein